jgi:Domain of unknown function (DUF4331)
MKKKIFLAFTGILVAAGAILYAADHIDAPAVTGPNSTSPGNDITDVYAFQSPADNSKMVFVINVQGLMSPSASATASFSNNTLYELNIDNTGDLVEDQVIQFVVQNNKLRVYGPAAPATTGLASTILANATRTDADVTPYGSSGSPNVGTNSNGIKVFAGPRDDPFFFDLVRFREVIAGTQSSFRSPGVDTFAGTNVMSLVIEVPKSLLGTAATLNVWAEAKTK